MARERRIEDNRLQAADRPAHDWYRFVLAFPPHLVRSYLARFGVGRGDRVLDPFCGTGTTLVECKKAGIASVGLEGNPMACMASRVKVDWLADPLRLLGHAREVGARVTKRLAAAGVADEPPLPLFATQAGATADLLTLPEPAARLLLRGSINPRSLHKALLLRATLRPDGDDGFTHELLALAATIVFDASNLQFGPEVGVGPAKADAAVVGPWLHRIDQMAADLAILRDRADVPAQLIAGDAREAGRLLEPESVDYVITSPPYPNEKDYTRTTRLESVVLGLIRDKAELRALKRQLVRSNTRGVYTTDRDDELVASNAEIQRIAAAIEERRRELGKTSGFERMYARVTKLYFGGMVRHLANLRQALRPGARLAYVVGDQASYLRVMIRTGKILADLADALGYEVVDRELFRTRLATATGEALREEVVLLRWPGPMEQ